jgi:hypothetical protein
MITPKCCKYAHDYIALYYDWYYAEEKDHFVKNKPFWVVRGTKMEEHEFAHRCNDGHFPTNVEMKISFCPNCGEKMPDIRLKDKPPEKVMTIIDGGYYCATCDERLDSCKCARPEELWELAP